jgi:flagellar motor switch protein FliM
MSRFETSHFQQFVEGLANPTHLTLFKLEPCRGICLLDLPLRAGLCILDRELGGPGQCLDDTRDLNRMEARLLARVVETIVSEWCAVWSDIMDLRPVLLRYENSGRFLQVHSPQITMLVVGMEIRIGDVVEQIQLSVPCRTLETLIVKLNADLDNVENSPVAALPVPPKWNPVLDEMNVKITAELATLELTANELSHLKPGDVIQIPPEMLGQIRLCLGTIPKFVGNLGRSGQRIAVKIEKALST